MKDGIKLAVFNAAETFGVLPSRIYEEWTPQDLAEFIAWRLILDEQQKKEIERAKSKIPKTPKIPTK